MTTPLFVEEWIGPGRRVPVFDVEPLRELLAGAPYRLFLAELLASYTKVSSGVVWVASAGGPRRHRFSDLDPVQLGGLLEALPDREHPGIFRRLGDLAPFLTGVFPDRAGGRQVRPVDLGRLVRFTPGVSGGDAAEWSQRGMLGVLEELGARWYRLAVPTPAVRSPDREVVEAVAGRFTDARRILNALTDRYLFPYRARWFGG